MMRKQAVARQDRQVTYLPDGPIAQHTMRRGIPRLHPVLDGKVDMQANQARITRRDMFGGKLIDVIDPVTGFCVGVRSNGYSAPNNPVGETSNPGVSGSHNGTTRQIVLNRSANGVLTDPETGHAIRTADMGDNPLPSIRGGNMNAGSQTQKGARNVAPRAPKSGPSRPTNPAAYHLPDGREILVPGGQSGVIRQAEILAVIEMFAKKRGVPVPSKITRAATHAARALLKQQRAAILKQYGITESTGR